MRLARSKHSKEEDPQGNFCFMLKRHQVYNSNFKMDLKQNN